MRLRELDSKVTSLKGVGPALAAKLERLKITQVSDLLFHLPMRYQDRTHITLIDQLISGRDVVVEGEITANQIRFGRRRSLLITLSDGSGLLQLRFFHFNKGQQLALSSGKSIRCFGAVRLTNAGFEMAHPEYQPISDIHPVPLQASLTPIYPATDGVSQQRLRQFTQEALSRLEDGLSISELLPRPVIEHFALPSLTNSLKAIHQPHPATKVEQLLERRHPAQQRLIFEELLAHQIAIRQLRAEARNHPAPQIRRSSSLSRQFAQQLPFSLTDAQRRVIDEIEGDLAEPMPMQRLVQGDVGSGKTVVAAAAALQVIHSGLQCTIMAPTELLATQHFQSFYKWLEPLGITTVLLTGRQSTKARQKSLQQIADGTAQLIVGTHALFQGEVQFARLGLSIIDEQHRFGVHQRLALLQKGGNKDESTHQLVMTATPIPRTLAMTAYADLDLSIIDELPQGRKPIKTVVLKEERRDEVIGRIQMACHEGRQIYWVCPLIEESEQLQCQAAELTYEKLQQQLPEITVGLIHGRMKSVLKDQLMAQFKSGAIDLLVATTVIEVGVDVPNATLMIIENSERLGLAQLHQLRGRVGRGTIQSHCLLLYKGPLSENGQSRLEVMRESCDGFVIAQRDLEIRGPGELLGTRQTGIVSYRIADIVRDQQWLEQINPLADEFIQHWPENSRQLVERWLGGDAEIYKSV
ncbi:MAG: ATP-dependent DNA helicase RecG [Gammaproteobacteria bacterium]|nr:ATP-dependent DNA helicase RecG [Gammaproteobacteria bacterium]